MVGKSSVSVLQEFCAKHKLTESPKYDFIADGGEDGGFVCRVEVLSMIGQGVGRSKRDAKHLAAEDVIAKLSRTHAELCEVPRAPQNDEIPPSDMIAALRDYCVQNDHPLPIIDIVQQGGTPDAPEFTAVCAVASIRRYGISDKKKDAKQKAAYEVLTLISTNCDRLNTKNQVATLDAKIVEAEADRYQKFKTYRELTESRTGVMVGVKLCDRHNYFKKFFEELKHEARHILSRPYESEREQAFEVMRALKITPKVKHTDSTTSMEPLLFIEFDCEYDVVFAGPESTVYKQIVQYFKEML